MKILRILLLTVATSTLLISCSDNSNDPVRADAPSDPELAVEVDELDFGTEQDTMSFRIGNSGGGDLEWEITSPDEWLRCLPAHGLLRDESIRGISVSVEREDLDAGSYESYLKVTPSVGEEQYIQVYMEVEEVLEPVVLIAWAGQDLDEDYYMSSDVFILPFDGYLQIEYRLISWPQDYGVELMLMSQSQYNYYQNGESFSAYWHETVVSEGFHTYQSSPMPANRSMRFIVDNTDWGWEDTDFDFVNDRAVYDVVVTLYPIE